MTDSSLTTSISLLTRGKQGNPSSYAAAIKKVPCSVSISERKKLDIFSSDVHPAPLRKKKPDSLVQLKEKEPKAAAAAVPKRKEPSSRVVQSYSLDRSACKILGDQPDKKRSKKIMDVLGMDALGVNFSQASMDDPNVLSFPSVTPSIMKDAIKTAKVVIKKKDLRIQELEDQIHVNIKKEKCVPPPKVLGRKWPDGRCYFGKEIFLTEMERKHHWLHFLNSIPEHCRTDSEKAKIKSLFSWFEKENLARNIGGEKCGLSEMWVFPPKKRRTLIHNITGKSKSFREYENIICKGEYPSLEEGIAALKMGRAGQNKKLMQKNAERIPDETYFEEDEYMINVPQDIFKFNFQQNINQNTSMWITSGGLVVYAYKSERDTLMLTTKGTQTKVMYNAVHQVSKSKSNSYEKCSPPNVILSEESKKINDPLDNDDGNLPYF